jgi:flagellar assembly protein FliH
MSTKVFKGAGDHEFSLFVIPAVCSAPAIEKNAAPEQHALSQEGAAESDAEITYAELEAAEHLRTAAAESLSIIEAARSDAAGIIAAAQAQAAEIEREARERGLAEARATHEAELGEAVADLRGRLVSTITEIAGLRQAIAGQAEHDLVRLALEIARKIIRREITADPDIVITLARIALERLPSRASARVRISPEEFDYVTANAAQLGPESSIELIADFAIRRGGCVVQSDSGTIDARIEEQLAVIERGLLSS